MLCGQLIIIIKKKSQLNETFVATEKKKRIALHYLVRRLKYMRKQNIFVRKYVLNRDCNCNNYQNKLDILLSLTLETFMEAELQNMPDVPEEKQQKRSSHLY